MSTFSEELHCIFDNSLTNQQKPLRFGMLAHNLMYFNIMAKNIWSTINGGTGIREIDQ
jgi:hypothetical protein